MTPRVWVSFAGIWQMSKKSLIDVSPTIRSSRWRTLLVAVLASLPGVKDKCCFGVAGVDILLESPLWGGTDRGGVGIMPATALGLNLTVKVSVKISTGKW